MARKFFEEKRPHNGLTYQDYFAKFVAKVNDIDPVTLDEKQRNAWEAKRLNLQRSLRVEKTYKLPEALKAAVRQIQTPQLWMVITEDWCGDSAQVLPQIVKIADENDSITLRIVPRDSNLDIMEQYLTDGKMGVPKIVAFDEDGNELFTWGPRPKEAAELFAEAATQGIPKTEIYPKLHLWYGRDRGKAVDREFLEIISKLNVRQPEVAV